jgi:hypothetical protein
VGLGRVKTFRPREAGDAKLNLPCYRNCELESTWFLVAPMRTLHVLDRRDEGFTPRMLRPWQVVTDPSRVFVTLCVTIR